MASADHAALVEAVPDGAVVHDPETGEIVATNAAFRELVGRAESDLVGTPLSRLSPDGRAYGVGDDRRLRRARERGAARFDWTVETAGGEAVPVEVSLAVTTRGGGEVGVATVRERPARDADGDRDPGPDPDRDRYRALFEHNQLILWEQDFSEAKRYVERLADDPEELVAYLDEHPEELAEIFERVEVRDVNETALDFYGADSREELAANLDALLTEDSMRGMAELWANVLRGETGFRKECEVRTLDGETRYEILEMIVPESHADDYSVVYTTGTDITEHRRRERQLAEFRDRYRTLFENGQLVLWEFDLSAGKRYAEGLVDDPAELVDHLEEHPGELEAIFERVELLDVNGTAVDYFGAASKADLLDRFADVLTEKSMATWRRLWRSVVAGETTLRTECEARTLDGEPVSMLVEMCVPEAHADEYDRVYLTGLDITDRVERERELRRQNEFLDEVTGVISHDLATPLGVVENRARLVELTDDPSHAEATDRVRDLLDELRDLARQGKQVGDTDPVELATVTRAAWRSVETPAATLTVDSSRTVEAHRDRLRQLLENLFENAVGHGAAGGDGGAVPADGSPASPDGGSASGGVSTAAPSASDDATAGVTVRVGVLPDGDGFYVADDGPGIPASERDRVFEQGYTTDEDGTGLGLAIVRRIADGHGWTVTATASEAGGARFEIRTDD